MHNSDMRRCVKCGHEDWGSIHYCPKCGTLFPGEKELTLVGEEDYKQATKVFDCVEVETKKWNEMKSFYESHLSTGYAPQGKQLIAKSELAQLLKNNLEYEQAVKANGKNYLGRIRCNVTQRHQKKINHVGFQDFWKRKIKDNIIFERCRLFLNTINIVTFCIGGIGILFLLIHLMVTYEWWGLFVSVVLGVTCGIGCRYNYKILD